MGKVDDMRAMREARYAARTAPSTPAKAAKAKKTLEAATSAGSAGAQSAAGELCGHRSISNKTCTREKDHAATGTKNHRYS